MQPPQALEEFQSAVQAEMQRLLAGRDLPLYDMLRYHLGWADAEGRPVSGEGGGKGLRSTLCLLVNQAVGGDAARALPVAAALELIHSFSLIHDDIQDQSPERRHRPAVWRIWGEAQAINAGDSLFTLGRLALYGLLDLEVPPENVLHAERVLDETCLRLCEGQFHDMEFQSRLDVSEESYLNMVEGKTAALIETSCYLGAYLGTANDGHIGHFQRAGRHLGFAFQIRDDILGIWGSEAELGKPVAEDIRSRKKTLPVVYALSHAGSLRDVLEGIYLRPRMSGLAVRRALEVFDELDARGHAQRVAEEHYHAALEEMEATVLHNRAMDQLKELALFAIEREF